VGLQREIFSEMILLTGGAGYIGSHLSLELLRQGQEIVILDNMSNSNCDAPNVFKKLFEGKCIVVRGDVRSKSCLARVFSKYSIQKVIHLAAYKSVFESMNQPLKYYDNNVTGLISLLDVMESFGRKSLIFSSSATVYKRQRGPKFFVESDEIFCPPNPYGSTKFICEQIIGDWCRADSERCAGVLRYFNPVGADDSALIGEQITAGSANLVPALMSCALGLTSHFCIYGTDYETSDGTAVRDFVHISDLIQGHVKALVKSDHDAGLNVWNLGTGLGITVAQVVERFESLIGRSLPKLYQDRREGDVAISVADISKASKELDFVPKFGIDDMLRSQWAWASKYSQSRSSSVV